MGVRITSIQLGPGCPPDGKLHINREIPGRVNINNGVVAEVIVRISQMTRAPLQDIILTWKRINGDCEVTCRMDMHAKFEMTVSGKDWEAFQAKNLKFEGNDDGILEPREITPITKNEKGELFYYGGKIDCVRFNDVCDLSNNNIVQVTILSDLDSGSSSVFNSPVRVERTPTRTPTTASSSRSPYSIPPLSFDQAAALEEKS